MATEDPSLLAIAVSANGRIDAREVAELDRLRAYRRLGIQRESFMTLADTAREEIGLTLADGRVTADERLVYASMLSHWGVTDTTVTHAIMRDYVR